MFLYDYCIWDFNGTILDDVQLGLNSVNTLLCEQGLPIIESKDAYRKRFDFPIIEYYKLLGFDFEKCPYEVLAERWVDEYMKNLEDAPMFSDVKMALDFFDSKNVKQTVLSASERKMLLSQLEGLGISDRFEEILGIDNIYGDSKLALAKRWREAHKDVRVMLIGDTVHDFENAKLLSADCYIVCAGHQCREKFDGINAKIFASLTELVHYLEEL